MSGCLLLEDLVDRLKNSVDDKSEDTRSTYNENLFALELR